MAKRTPADAAGQSTPPLKPARKRVKRLGKAAGGSKTAQELGIEVEGAGGLDYSKSPIGPPPPHLFEESDAPAHQLGKTIFPSPDSFQMNWEKFRRYWQVVFDNPEMRQRLRVFIYRTWPVMYKDQGRMGRLDGVPDDSPTGHDLASPLTIQDILHRWGSGSYHLKIHDLGAKNRNICGCHIESAKLRNSDYPPLLDMNKLDPADPFNATFLETIKSRRLSGEDITEDQMAAEIVEMAKIAIDASKGTDPAGTAAMDVMAHAAKTGMDLVAKAAEKDPPPIAPAAPALDPMALVTSVLGVVKELSGGGGEYMEAMRLAQESERAMHKSQMEFLQTQMKEMREAATASATAAQAAPPLKPEGAASPGVLGQMRELVEMKDLARELVGRGGGGSSWADLAPVAVQAAQPLIQGLSMWLASQATGGAQTAPQAGQAPQQGPSPTPSGIIPEIAGAMEQLRAPLMRIFNDPERDGTHFADFFVDMAGEDAYRQLTSVGPEQLHSFIMSYQPLAQELAGREEKLQKFIFEFMDAFHAAPEDGGGPEPSPEGQDQEQAGEATQPLAPIPPMTGAGYFGLGGSPIPAAIAPDPEEPADSEAPVEVLEAELEEPPAEELTPEADPLDLPVKAEAKPMRKKAAKRAKEK